MTSHLLQREDSNPYLVAICYTPLLAATNTTQARNGCVTNVHVAAV